MCYTFTCVIHLHVLYIYMAFDSKGRASKQCSLLCSEIVIGLVPIVSFFPAVLFNNRHSCLKKMAFIH